MAVTLDFAKVNSDLYTLGTLYKTAQITAYRATFATALTADSRPGGDNTAITIGTLRQVANELNAMMFQVNALGTIVVFVTDGHHVDAESLDRRLTAIAGAVTVAEETILGGLTIA